MAQVRGTFAALYDNVDKTVFAVFRDQLKELQYAWESVYNIKTSKKKFERVQTVTGMGDVPLKPEGEVYAFDLIRPGYSKDFTHLEFGMGFEVTETALEDDDYDQLVRASEWLMFSARYVQAKYAAAPFNNGFTSELTPDGETFFDTAHPLAGGGTAANTLSAAADLSRTSLIDALTDIQTETKLESGQVVMPITDLVLYIPPALEMVADPIVNSAGLPGSADNDRNPIKARRKIRIEVDPLLTDEDSWFLLNANQRQHGLTTYKRVPISAIPPATDPYTGNRIYKVRFRQSWGVWMWQGIFGVQGA